MADAFGLSRSSYRGRVSDLMRAGSAKPFLQPWYTPISCTPADTGMPSGGIGSAFTLTPAGTTPVLSFLDGLHVTAPEGAPLRLRNLFFAERDPDTPLVVADAGMLLHRNQYTPLAGREGRPWIPEGTAPGDVASILSRMAGDARLYRDNETALKRWKVTLSPKTKALLAQGDSPDLSKALLLDVYGGSLRLQPRFQASLTSDVDGKEIAGQPAYPADRMEYAGLYPLYETDYRSGSHALKLRIRGYSPILAGDERACSLPVSITEVEIENPTDQPLEATVAWTLENICGDQVSKVRPGVQDAWFHLVRTAMYQTGECFRERTDGNEDLLGIHLSQGPSRRGGDFDGSLALAMACESPERGFYATAQPCFHAVAENAIVAECLGTGRVAAPAEDALATGRERRMGALCATVLVPPGAVRCVSFALALDFPLIRMREFRSEKKYASAFPDPDRRAAAMAAETLSRRSEYRARIEADHAAGEKLGGIPGILSSRPSPAAGDRLLTLLANNLAFLADAAVWDREDRFWVRECADYPFFNSLDVYFYGSFSVLRLLPRLDGCVLREFAKAVLAEDATRRRHWIYSGQPFADLPDPRHEGPRSVTGAVPHDMGSPFDPAPDAYIWHNVKHWKDLAPKFLLLVWRHYKLTGDKAFLADCREAVFSALKYLSDMRAPGETIPLTHGTDDTFDNMASHGISIYCGSLWVAALFTGAAIAEATGSPGLAEEWRAIGTLARRDLAQNLWDDEAGYYRFYKVPGNGETCDHVFADQLLADLWLEMLDLPEITPRDNRLRASRMVLETGFRKHSPGVGAPNACAKDGGSLDSFQAQDIWLGVQYSLAAAAARAGETQGAWEILEAQYDNLYVKAGIPFGAPEGFNATASAAGDSPDTRPLKYTAGRYLRPGMAWVFAWPFRAL